MSVASVLLRFVCFLRVDVCLFFQVVYIFCMFCDTLHVLVPSVMPIFCMFLRVDTCLFLLCRPLFYISRELTPISYLYAVQVFDAVIILASFALDLVFLEGIAESKGEETAALLIGFLLWRLLRVINGQYWSLLSDLNIS